MSHRLYSLEKASHQGKEAVRTWFEDHLLRLKIDDLLAKKSGGCPCQACHELQHGAFKRVLELIGKERLHETISQILQKAPRLSMQNASVAWVFNLWFEGHDPGVFVRPLSINARPLINFLNQLSKEQKAKLHNDPVFKRFIADGTSVAEALRYFDLADTVVKRTLVNARYSAEMAWVHDFIAKLEPEKPVVDLTLPFGQRWGMFLEGKRYQFIRAFFTLPDDRSELVESIPRLRLQERLSMQSHAAKCLGSGSKKVLQETLAR